MRILIITAAVFQACVASSIEIDPLQAGDCSTDQTYLQYDDGTAGWLIWQGMWRGVWFNLEDFIPGGLGCNLDFTEFWFYHHSAPTWDVGSFYAEVWNGDHLTPLEFLDQTQVTAVHYSPVFANYTPQLEVESNFWVLINTEMSSGGWPSSLSDSTASAVDHSYYSYDFALWEPCALGDYLIRCEGDILTSLENSTWGEIKAIF